MTVVAQQRTWVRIASACAALSVALATFYRLQKPTVAVPPAPVPIPRALPPDGRTRVLGMPAADRFVRKPSQPSMLPHAVWINPTKEQSASQDRAGATISTADDLRGGALNVEVLGVAPETTGAYVTLSRLRHTRFYTKCPRQVSQSR